MKKFFGMTVVAMLAMVTVSAQDELGNEIGIAYGGGSNTDIISSLSKGMFTGKQTSYWGPVSVEYFHYNDDGRLAFGGIGAVSGCKWDDNSDAKSVFFTLMPAIKYKWVNKTHFGMYSKAALGATLMKESGSTSNTSKTDNTKVVFNWQASFIGMEYGSAFRVFAELGMGEQGIILGGLRYRF